MELPRRALNDGHDLPAIGLGTYPLRGEEGVAAMTHALEIGYRLLDTAVNYGNEEEVGQALRRSGVPRDDVVVTSKIPGRHHRYDDAVRSAHQSLERLRLDRLDLLLIHWPNPARDRYVEAWRALVDLRDQGVVSSIGVSNFTRAHLERLIAETGVTPAVNQVELHPAFPQVELRAVHAELGILTEAWSPLGKRQAPYAADPVRPPRPRTAWPPRRRSCAGSSSSGRCRSPSRRTPSGRPPTSTCSASS